MSDHSTSADLRRPTHVKSGLRIRELVDAKDPALKRAYALLLTTFHKSERIHLSEWKSSMQEKTDGLLTDLSWHLFVAEREGKVLGLVSGTYLGNVNLGTIGYLASDPAVRSLGIGSRLRARLATAFERDAKRITGKPLAGILGEVTADNPWLRALARRPNVLVLDFPYFQPKLYEEDKPTPFRLYLESRQRIRRRVPASELRRVLYTVWRRVYRVGRPISRPAFRAMMRALADRTWIGPYQFPKRIPRR